MPGRSGLLAALLGARGGLDVHMLDRVSATDAGCSLTPSGRPGYSAAFPEPAAGEYGVMIISRFAARPDPITDKLTYLPTRVAGISLSTDRGPVRVLGAYVASRDASPEKVDRKRRWLSEFSTALDTAAVPTLFLGDLNVLEPDHQPRYRLFQQFEYDFAALNDGFDRYSEYNPWGA